MGQKSESKNKGKSELKEYIIGKRLSKSTNNRKIAIAPPERRQRYGTRITIFDKTDKICIQNMRCNLCLADSVNSPELCSSISTHEAKNQLEPKKT